MTILLLYEPYWQADGDNPGKKTTGPSRTPSRRTGQLSDPPDQRRFVLSEYFLFRSVITGFGQVLHFRLFFFWGGVSTRIQKLTPYFNNPDYI